MEGAVPSVPGRAASHGSDSARPSKRRALFFTASRWNPGDSKGLSGTPSHWLWDGVSFISPNVHGGHRRGGGWKKRLSGGRAAVCGGWRASRRRCRGGWRRLLPRKRQRASLQTQDFIFHSLSSKFGCVQIAGPQRIWSAGKLRMPRQVFSQFWCSRASQLRNR